MGWQKHLEVSLVIDASLGGEKVILLLSYRGLSGRIYQLNNKCGEGGEGIVYDLLNDEKQVAKIYKTSHFKNRSECDVTERKLKAMLSMNLSGYVDNVLLFAWPQDILFDNETLVGFIMPKINSNLKIYSIYRMGDDVKKIYPEFTWKYSLQFAYNLAWAVHYLHSKGIVVGDFNQNNIYIDTVTSAVVFIDCDSFEITDPSTSEHFPCTVGFSEVLAPELQNVGYLRNGRFTKESDNFSLAIHIFRLLMKNADPFGGIIASGPSSSSVPLNRAIINGECQYVRDVGKTIPDWSPKLEAMPLEIQELFNKTFNYTALTATKCIKRRATAEEWCNALIPYAKPGQNRKLKRCLHNRLHVYAAHNKKCPWCVCEGHDYDPDVESISRYIKFLSISMSWLILILIISELIYLCRIIGFNQTSWTIFVNNLFMIKREF
ncbi:MAG: hypothetical protein K5644_10035, partial [Lachnospiraceae bacterium]|nr:hypothetical protein [Lachnospiraceae bacterium]